MKTRSGRWPSALKSLGAFKFCAQVDDQFLDADRLMLLILDTSANAKLYYSRVDKCCFTARPTGRFAIVGKHEERVCIIVQWSSNSR